MAVPALCRTSSWVNTLLTSAKKKLATACSKIDPSPFSSVFVR